MTVRRRFDPARLLAPTGAVIAPVLVALALIILTMREPTPATLPDVEIARADPARELLPDEAEPELPKPIGDPLETEVEITVDLPEPRVEDLLPTPDPSHLVCDAPRLVDTRLVALVRSPVTMKSVTGQARAAGGRAAALARHGGSGAGEACVLRALRWLKTRQQADGTWREKGEGDATAFALLTFLAHGEGLDSPEFGETVRRAVQAVARRHTSNMATYALAEAAAVIRSPVVREIAEDAVSRLCRRQSGRINANGGGAVPRYCGVMALVSAKLARLRVPELPAVWKTFSEAYGSMRDRQANEGRALRGEGAWHYMIAGVCLQYLGKGGEPLTRLLLARLDELWPPPTLGTSEIACCPVRSNLFATMFFFNAGGERWTRWNEGLVRAYVGTQTVAREGASEVGWWTCRDKHIGAQPFWPTCYIALQLMVYYRYLPTHTPEAWSVAPPAPPRTNAYHIPEVFVEVDI